MRLKSFLTAGILAFSLSGCSAAYDAIVFQIDVGQGNFVEEKQVQQLTLGMNREQVSYIMGSPMMIDTFDADKWYYLYYFKPGGEKVEQKQIELVFKDEKLIQVKGDDTLTSLVKK
ncbi:outer membrane protein assembly factor BamE [Motilimonas pumila]|uniref:Outer membrane protein assembly factor BamE n=1 Tax=Motilimonas pumila TaxID=2303987 RepID=A0A418YK64_9GAMM|nr:outer membrane protein assembly factor BamE [Motilimonas pumila]RJG51372.1 outer membrane protein assembly factor BamE [Motilimonas pumila]